MVSHDHAATERSRQRLVAPVVVVALALALGIGLVVSRQHAAPAGAVTSTAPASFVLPSLTGGGDVRLSAYRGHPVVVVLFASWCSACQAELPNFATVARQVGHRVTFIGVDSEETSTTSGLAMARQLGIGGWPLARDVDGSNVSGLHDALGVLGMPATAFYSSAGRLQTTVVGQVAAAELRSHLATLDGISS